MENSEEKLKHHPTFSWHSKFDWFPFRDSVNVFSRSRATFPIYIFFFLSCLRWAPPAPTSACWRAAWWRWSTSGRCCATRRWPSSSWWGRRPCSSWPGCSPGWTTTPTSSGSSPDSSSPTRCCRSSPWAGSTTGGGRWGRHASNDLQ